MDWATIALLGSTLFMLLMQVALIPTYRTLHLTLGFWAFTFSADAVAAQAIILSGLVRYPGWEIVAIAAITAVTILITAIAVKSLTAKSPSTRGARAKERQITEADDQVAHA